MARLRIRELMDQHGLSQQQMAAILWPDTKPHTRRVLMARWMKAPVVTIRLEQLQYLFNAFESSNLIEYETTD